MIRWTRSLAGAALVAAAISAHAACTTTINPGADITATVAAAAPGSIICLNPGTYTPNPATYPFSANIFGIGNNVTVLGAGATPSSVVLQAGGSSFAIY